MTIEKRKEASMHGAILATFSDVISTGGWFISLLPETLKKRSKKSQWDVNCVPILAENVADWWGKCSQSCYKICPNFSKFSCFPASWFISPPSFLILRVLQYFFQIFFFVMMCLNLMVANRCCFPLGNWTEIWKTGKMEDCWNGINNNWTQAYCLAA